MMMVRSILLAAFAWLAGAVPALAQVNVPFSTYITGAPTASSLAGTERIVGLQSGAIKTLTPYQILSIVAGDCSMVSPPSLICTKTNGLPFVASATTDTTNAGNIGSGTLNLQRLSLANTHIYVGNASGNPADVALSGDCTINAIGAITCTKTGGASFVASATTNTTNASNISSGTLGTARLPSPFTSGARQGNTSNFVTYSGSAPVSGHVATYDASGNIQDGGAAGSGTVTEQKNTAGAGLSTSGNCDNLSSNAGSPCQYQIVAGSVPGIATNTAASAGNVGEVIVSSLNTGTLPNASPVVGASISLTAGDWDISGQIEFNAGGSTSVTDWSAAISTTGSSLTPITNSLALHERVTAMNDHSSSMAFAPIQVLPSTTTTYFLNVQATYTGVAPNANVVVRARRMR